MNQTSKSWNDDVRPHSFDQQFDLSIIVDTDTDLGALLGARPALKLRERYVRNMVMAQAILRSWYGDGGWIYYSRDQNYYTGLYHYGSGRISLKSMIWAVNSLAEAGIIEHRRALPASKGIFRSTFRLSPALGTNLPITTVGQIRQHRREVIVLKDADKKLIPYKDTERTRYMRRDVCDQNAHVSSASIRLESNEWCLDQRGLLRHDIMVVNPILTSTYRVFNERLSLGGRFYGPWWQNLPKIYRKQLTINSQPVVEVDYASQHPRFLAARSGSSLNGGDPYEIDGFHRGIVKVALNILVNAKTESSAQKAIIRKLRAKGSYDPALEVARLIEAIKQRHPQFEPYWGTGEGRVLQRVDSALCARVQARVRQAGEVVLSVHDSFIVRQRAEGLLREVMEDEMERILRWLSDCPCLAEIRD